MLPQGLGTHLALRQRFGGTHGTAGTRGTDAALTMPTEQTTPLRQLLQEREARSRTQHGPSHTTLHYTHSADPDNLQEISNVVNKSSWPKKKKKDTHYQI